MTSYLFNWCVSSTGLSQGVGSLLETLARSTPVRPESPGWRRTTGVVGRGSARFGASSRRPSRVGCSTLEMNPRFRDAPGCHVFGSFEGCRNGLATGRTGGIRLNSNTCKTRTCFEVRSLYALASGLSEFGSGQGRGHFRSERRPSPKRSGTMLEKPLKHVGNGRFAFCSPGKAGNIRSIMIYIYIYFLTFSWLNQSGAVLKRPSVE